MICINLLPWRESRLKKMKRIALCQLASAIVFLCLIVATYCFWEQERLVIKRQSVSDFRQLNQQVLKKIESLDSDSYGLNKLNVRHLHLINVIHQKNKLPAILALLTARKRTGQFTQLFVSQQSLKITYAGAEVDDSLALFQLLNSYSGICEVSFAPATSADYKRQVDQQGLLNQQIQGRKHFHQDEVSYEFNASLCDIPAS